ncbi:MAG: PAS domain S-box protein [Crocinitomicaceae bacterium]|nr:PAS domain S-box protein [Crocinitomicaceae bacterium]
MENIEIIVQPQGRILSVNGETVNELGYSKDELIGKQINTILLGNYKALLEVHSMEDALNKGGKFTQENIILSKDQRKIPVLLLSSSLKDEKGEIEGFLLIAQDVSQHEKAQQELKESETRLRSIINSGLDAIITIDSHGVITEWNKLSEEIFGWNASEAIGKTLSELIIPKKYRESHFQGLRHYMKTKEGPILNKRIEIEAIKKSGDQFPIELTVTPIEIKNKICFSGFIRDITKSKQIEKELKDSERKFRNLFENASVGIVMIDSLGRIVLFNKLSEAIFEYKSKEVIDKSIEILIPDELRKSYSLKINTFFEHPRQFLMASDTNFLGKKKDGTHFPMEMALTHDKTEEGNFAIAYIKDITVEREAKDKIENALKEKDFLIREIHHRVKNNMQLFQACLGYNL